MRFLMHVSYLRLTVFSLVFFHALVKGDVEVSVLSPFGCELDPVHEASVKYAAMHALTGLSDVPSGLKWLSEDKGTLLDAFKDYLGDMHMVQYLNKSSQRLVGMLEGSNANASIHDRVRFVVFCKDALREQLKDEEQPLVYVLENEPDRGSVTITIKLDANDEVRVDYEWATENDSIMEQLLLSRYQAMRAKFAYSFIPIIVDHGGSIEEAIEDTLVVVAGWSFEIKELAEDERLHMAQIRLQSLMSVFNSILASAEEKNPDVNLPPLSGELLALDFLRHYDPEFNYELAYAVLARETVDKLMNDGPETGYHEFLRRYCLFQELRETGSWGNDPASRIREEIKTMLRPKGDSVLKRASSVAVRVKD